MHASLFSMASMATSADEGDTRSEASSTWNSWSDAQDDEQEPEVYEVGDVAALLPNEYVVQVDVCDGEPYKTTHVAEGESIEVVSKEVVIAEMVEEIEVDFEEDMPQGAKTQDVVPPHGNYESLCASIKKDFKELVNKNPDKAKELIDELANSLKKQNPLPTQPVDVDYKSVRLILTSESSVVRRKSTRNGKKRTVTDVSSGVLKIIKQRATTHQNECGSDFLVVEDGMPDLWIYEDDLRDTDRGCEAFEVFDKKRRRCK